MANPVNKDIALDWETTLEINNMRFDVMRSTDGLQFAKIGEVAPLAVPGEVATYNFLDQNVEADVVYYYQLKQHDFDGNTSQSNIVSAMVPGAAVDFVRAVFPNPFEDVVNIEVRMAFDAKVKVEITNIAGQSLGVAREFDLRAGKQMMRLNLKEMAAGMYFAKISVNGVSMGAAKIVKAK